MTWKEIPNCYGLKHPCNDGACSPPTPGDVVDAEVNEPIVEAGRNDPCPCGSGKKFKKCCGRRTT